MNVIKRFAIQLFGSKKNDRRCVENCEIISSNEKSNIAAAKQKAAISAEFSSISSQARKIKKQADRLVKSIDTAYYIAKASGAL